MQCFLEIRDARTEAQIDKEQVDLEKRRSSVIIGAFKCLESDALILVVIVPKDERCDRNDRYVALSRCRHLLYVFCNGDWLGS
jgi:DNA helicase IV